MISRQAMRAEIEYHGHCIRQLENEKTIEKEKKEEQIVQEEVKQVKEKSIQEKIDIAIELWNDKKYTEAIEKLRAILDQEDVDLQAVVEIRSKLASIYQEIGE